MKIAPQGFKFIGLALGGAAAVGLLLQSWLFAIPFVVLAGFCAFFFRDPTRIPPAEPGALVSPGDGKVVYVGAAPEDASRKQVTIFLSLFNVHINRSPLAAVVQKITYRPGKFFPAYKVEASTKNEQNELQLADGDFRVTVRQIAGIAARRIVCFTKENAHLTKGERFGLIQFGSRMEVLLPAETELRVELGDRVKGGETVIAERM